MRLALYTKPVASCIPGELGPPRAPPNSHILVRWLDGLGSNASWHLVSRAPGMTESVGCSLFAPRRFATSAAKGGIDIELEGMSLLVPLVPFGLQHIRDIGVCRGWHPRELSFPDAADIHKQHGFGIGPDMALDRSTRISYSPRYIQRDIAWWIAVPNQHRRPSPAFPLELSSMGSRASQQ